MPDEPNMGSSKMNIMKIIILFIILWLSDFFYMGLLTQTQGTSTSYKSEDISVPLLKSSQISGTGPKDQDCQF
jgi:hypothetical protein